MDKRALRAAFDRAAATYDAAAFLQQEVARRLDERLEVMKIEPFSILDVGCGTGHALPLLQARYPKARLIGLDLAYGMLQAARGKCMTHSLLGRLAKGLGYRSLFPAPCSLVCADLDRLPLNRDGMDLVWSNLTLQWVESLEGAFREVHGVLKPGGLFAFSTFGPDTLKELRASFAGLDGYGHVNRFVDMHDIGDALVHAGFANPVMEMEMITLTYADLKAMLRDLKAIGAHTVLQGRRPGLMGRREWQALVEHYEGHRRDGRLPATFEVIYGHAWAGRKDVLLDGRQIIRLRIEKKRSGL